MNRKRIELPVIQKHLRIVRDRHRGDLEKACHQCGGCCHAKVQLNGTWFLVKGLSCKYLRPDPSGGTRCAVYSERHEKAPWCQDLALAIEEGSFPALCPYVNGLHGYHGPVHVDGADARLVEAVLRERLRGKPRREWADPAAWDAFMAGGAP